MPEEENKEKKGLTPNTVVFMISSAIFVDFLQFILGFFYMGWLVGIFAALSYYVWFKMNGINFMKPKRFLTFGAASLIEILPIPFLADLPAWTAAVSYLALSSKLQEVIPGADITKLDIMKK